MADPAKLVQELFDILGGASKKPKVTPVKPQGAPGKTPPPKTPPPTTAAGVPVSQQPGKLVINPPPGGGPPGAGVSQSVKPPPPPSPATPPGPLPPGGSPPPTAPPSAAPPPQAPPALPPTSAPTPPAKFTPFMPATGQMPGGGQEPWRVKGLGTGDIPMLGTGGTAPTFEEVQHAINANPPAQIKDPGTRDLAERRERAAQQGYSTPAFKAIKQPTRITGASMLREGGSFSAQNIELAKQYAASGYGSEILPLLLDTSEYMVYNAEGKVFSHYNKKVVEAAKAAGKKGVVVINGYDTPSGKTPAYGFPNLGPQVIYITIDPGTARSAFAKFDPAKKGINDLLASGLAHIIPPVLAGALFEKYGATPAGAAEANDHAMGAAGLDEFMQSIFPGAESKSRDLDATMNGIFGHSPNVARETVPPNKMEQESFWSQLLGDIQMEAIESANVLRDVGKRAEERNLGQRPIASPKELGAEFLDILSGGAGLAFSPITGALKTTVGRPAAQRETEKMREKIGTPRPGYKLPEQKEAEEAQAGEIADAASFLVPGMGVLPGVGAVTKFGYSHLFAGPKTPLETFAGKISDDLHVLRQTATADKEQLTQYVKTLPLAGEAAQERMLPKFIADRDKTKLLGRVEEIVYHLIEDKDISKLSQADQFFLSNPNNLQLVLAAAKHIAPLRLEASKLYEYLTKLKGIPKDELVDPNYVHRRAIGHTPTVDPLSQNPNPITGYSPKQKTVPTTTTALQERFYQGGEAPSGRRVVAGQDEATGAWQVYEPGKPPALGKAIDEDHFEFQGETFTVGNATTREIEAATPTRYHKNALANTTDAVARLRAVARHSDWLDALKKNPLWGQHAVQNATIGKARGWREVDLPQLKGWYMEPKMANVFDDFMRSSRPEDVLSGFRKLNQFATASLFWNPTPHIENVWGHWLVGRGFDWITPQGARSLFVDGARAIRAVTTQNADYQRLLKNGSGMIFGGVANANFYQDIARLAGMEITREPNKWDPIARILGYGPTDMARSIYEASKRTLWWANDVFMMQRVLELERKGKSVKEAIKEAEKHIPNYRIPTEVLGSRMFSQVLQEPAMTVFSRYHYGVFRSYANMLRDAFGPTASAKERFDAMGNMLALGVLTWVAYPILDKALQKTTGEEDARKLRRGPSARIDLLAELYEGKKNWPQFISESITLPPATRAVVQIAGGGRDPFTGQPITEPGSTGTEQAVQGADWALGTIVAPYKLLGKRGEEEGGRSFKRRIFDQVVGAQDTSEAAERGRRIGERIDRRRAQKRRLHPRGFLERATTYGGTDE